jgi:hypothetical protein
LPPCHCAPRDRAPLELPEAAAGVPDRNDDPDDRIVLNVDREGRVLFRGEVRSPSELAQILAEEKRRYAYEAARRRTGPGPSDGDRSQLYKVQYAIAAHQRVPGPCLVPDGKLEVFLPSDGEATIIPFTPDATHQQVITTASEAVAAGATNVHFQPAR